MLEFQLYPVQASDFAQLLMGGLFLDSHTLKHKRDLS